MKFNRCDLIWLAVFAIGCSRQTTVPPPLSNPLQPMTVSQLTDPGKTLSAARTTDEPAVKDLLIMMSNVPQDFDGDGRFDGYVIRVMMLNSDGRPVRQVGLLRFELIPDQRTGHVMPITVWEASPQRLPSDWRETRILPGYAFFLRWLPQHEPKQEDFLMKTTFWPLDGRGPISKSLLFRSMVKNKG